MNEHESTDTDEYQFRLPRRGQKRGELNIKEKQCYQLQTTFIP